MMEIEIVLTDGPAPEAREAILDGLVRFNVERFGPSHGQPLAVLICDRDTGKTIGGLWGRTSWSWLFIELLFVPESYRGTGIGASLIRQAEAEAISRGCTGVWLDTYSFQARGFYERLGYTLFGTIEDYPPGHNRFFFKKRFVPGIGEA
jgi:GNAT superfamily N-acetyltransferase